MRDQHIASSAHPNVPLAERLAALPAPSSGASRKSHWLVSVGG